MTTVLSTVSNKRFDEQQKKISAWKRGVTKVRVTKLGETTVTGLEPIFSDPKSDALPLSYTAC